MFPARVSLKGTLSRDGYFFESRNILICTLCVRAQGFQGLFKSFSHPIQLLTFYLLFLNYLLILMLTDTLLSIPFSMIGRFFIL
jgi:hypothetical protein